MDWSQVYKAPRASSPKEPFVLWDKPKGINKVIPAPMLSRNEFVSLTNVKINDFGQLETREGLTKVTSLGADSNGDIKHISYVTIGSNSNIFMVDDAYKIYKLTGSAPSLTHAGELATLEGNAVVLSFGGYGVILDGGYIKYTNGTAVKIAYDDGTGERGYTYTATCSSKNTTYDLYSGGNTKAGIKKAVQAWTAGYTIPLTTTKFWLSKTGSPTGTLTATVRDTTGATLHGTATTTLDVSTLTTGAVEKSFTFDGSWEMTQSATYHFMVEYSGGDAANYVSVHGGTVASGGNGAYYDGSYKTDATWQCCAGVKPGRPPKAAFGDVKDGRLQVAGDPDNPGYIWYSNVNSFFDWSTPSGGGYISAIDDDADSFPVGAIVAHFGDIFVFGKQSHPYISRLTGTGPSTWTLPPLFQQSYTNHNAILSLINDIWFVSGDGVHNLMGVQEYGDIRTFNPGDPILTTIRDSWSTAAFVGYNPPDGQLWVKLNGVSNTLVCHTRHPYQRRNGTTGYPWTEYSFTGVTPSAFGTVNGVIYVGATDGHLYKLDTSVWEDNSSAYDLTIESGFQEFPFGTTEVSEIYNTMYSASPLSATLSFYANGSTSSLLDMCVTKSVNTEQYDANFNCESIKAKLSNWTFTTRSVLNGMMLKTRRLLNRSGA